MQSDHPKCPSCGKQEFQVVEDVPRAYRHHEMIDGVLVFDPEHQEVCWDGCGGIYQYLECRGCQTRMKDVRFAFGVPEDAHTGFDEDDGLRIAVISDGGLVKDVYCSNRKAAVEVLYLDDIEIGLVAEDDEIAAAEAEEERIGNRLQEIIEDKDMCCVA